MLNWKNYPSPCNVETIQPSILLELQSANNNNNNYKFLDRISHYKAIWEIKNQEHKIARINVGVGIYLHRILKTTKSSQQYPIIQQQQSPSRFCQCSSVLHHIRPPNTYWWDCCLWFCPHSLIFTQSFLSRHHWTSKFKTIQTH